MALTNEKVLWVVGFASVAWLIERAKYVKATAVAVRTDNLNAATITACKQNNFGVYGWRWPSSKDASAMAEADHAASLFAAGMDGYYVDPEAHPKASLNWDQPGLEGVATNFCTRVKNAANGKTFGVTSVYTSARAWPNLPWPVFFSFATILLPQAYWRTTEGIVGHGDPADNYRRSIEFWTQAGATPSLIAPMAGEIALAKPDEIEQYAAAVLAANVPSRHFYTAESDVSPAVWDAISQA